MKLGKKLKYLQIETFCNRDLYDCVERVNEGKKSLNDFNPLVSTKRSHIFKQTCSFQLQVCLSMDDLLVDTRR